MTRGDELGLGAPAPPLRLTDARGATFDLAELRGRAQAVLYAMRAFG